MRLRPYPKSMDNRAAAYDEDFEGWLLSQAALLRARSANALDWDNLAEEIESLGRSQYKELASRLARIVEHLLKLRHGRDRAPRQSWVSSLMAQRGDVELLLEQNPGLKTRLEDAYRHALKQGQHFALKGFYDYEPERGELYRTEIEMAAPFSLDQCLDADFLPAGPSQD